MRFVMFAALAVLSACDRTGETPRALDTGITVSGHFGEDGEASENVSGLACDWQAGGGTLRCLIIEDEGDAAQWVTFDGAVLGAGQRFLLRPNGPSLGSPPTGLCLDQDLDNPEIDGEAAAFSDGVYYVTGSHGCSRNSDELRPSGFVVSRIAPDSADSSLAPGSVALASSYRLGSLLSREPALARYYGASLNRANGLNIEGLAVQGDRMIFGLRGPVINGAAYLFETSETALFSREIVGPGRAIPVALGENVGIRDLAFLPDGRLLILSGPAQEQDLPYRIQLRGEDGAVTVLETIEAPYGGKAEAMAVIGLEGDSVSLLVMFDGVDDGAPRIVRVALPTAE